MGARRVLAWSSTAAAIGFCGLGFAQENEDNGSLFVDFSNGTRLTDNAGETEGGEGTSLINRTSVALGYLAETRSQKLAFGIGTSFEVASLAEDSTYDEANDRFIDLAYERYGIDGNLELELGYRERDNGFDFRFDPASSVDLILDQGDRQDARALVRYEFGEDSAILGDIAFRYDERAFDGTTDPNLTDQSRVAFDANILFPVSRSMSVGGFFNFSEREEENSTDTVETEFAYGVSFRSELARGTSLDAQLGYSENSSEDTIGGQRIESVETGPSASLTLTQDAKNGTYGLNYSASLSQAGTRNAISVNRLIETDDEAFSFSIGISSLTDGDPNFIGSLSYVRDVKSGSIDLSASQSVNSEFDGDETLFTGLSARYTRDINSLSRAIFGLSYSAAEDLEDGSTFTRTGLTATYQRDLTEDWSLNTGYAFLRSTETGREEIEENRIFANISRRFYLRR